MKKKVIDKDRIKKVSKDTIEKVKKTNLRTMIIILFVLLLVIVGLIFVKNTFIKDNKKEVLEKELLDMGKVFYEDFYYKQIEATDLEIENFLSKFKTIGIKINLDSLARYNNQVNKSRIEKFVNEDKKDDKDCNRNESMLIIYPKDPYGKKDYTYKVVLECGFEK